MSSPCGTPNSVLNGQYTQTGNSTEYTCLTGFYMSGTKILTCSYDGSTYSWGTAPTCNVITDNDYIYFTTAHSWWWYFLAAWLSLLLIAAFIALIYCCCCRGGYCLVGGRGGTAGCCPWDKGGRCCSCCPRRPGHVDQVYGQDVYDVEYGDVIFVPVRTVQRPKRTNRRPGPIHVTPVQFSSSTPDSRLQAKEEDQGSASDGDLASNKNKARAPVGMWMPHSHPVRKINTSTK